MRGGGSARADDGRGRGAVGATHRSAFATPWTYQVRELLRRDCRAHWRDPTYLLAKLALNAVAGLFIGFTFFKAKTTIQGTQNHLFVSLGSRPRVAAVLMEARRRSSCP